MASNSSNEKSLTLMKTQENSAENATFSTPSTKEYNTDSALQYFTIKDSVVWKSLLFGFAICCVLGFATETIKLGRNVDLLFAYLEYAEIIGDGQSSEYTKDFDAFLSKLWYLPSILNLVGDIFVILFLFLIPVRQGILRSRITTNRVHAVLLFFVSILILIPADFLPFTVHFCRDFLFLFFTKIIFVFCVIMIVENLSPIWRQIGVLLLSLGACTGALLCSLSFLFSKRFQMVFTCSVIAGGLCVVNGVLLIIYGHQSFHEVLIANTAPLLHKFLKPLKGRESEWETKREMESNANTTVSNAKNLHDDVFQKLQAKYNERESSKITVFRVFYSSHLVHFVLYSIMMSIGNLPLLSNIDRCTVHQWASHPLVHKSSLESWNAILGIVFFIGIVKRPVHRSTILMICLVLVGIGNTLTIMFLTGERPFALEQSFHTWYDVAYGFLGFSMAGSENVVFVFSLLAYVERCPHVTRPAMLGMSILFSDLIREWFVILGTFVDSNFNILRPFAKLLLLSAIFVGWIFITDQNEIVVSSKDILVKSSEQTSSSSSSPTQQKDTVPSTAKRV